MDKTVIIARIRKWQAELEEMLETLRKDGETGPIIDILKKRDEELEALIRTIQDKSFIPQEDVPFAPEPVVNEIVEKVKKVKAGVRKLAALRREEEALIGKLSEEA